MVRKPSNWDPCPGMWVLARGSGKTRNSQPLEATLVKCEGEISLQGRLFSVPTQMEHSESTWCLRELAVLEIIFPDNKKFPNNPDSIQCTQNMSCAKSLGVLAWKEGEEEVGILVWQTPDT